MLKKGKDKIIKETEEKAKLLYDFFEQHHIYKPIVPKKYRSKTTLVIDVKGEGIRIKNKLEEKGFIIGSGYGKNKEQHIRIANFPAHTLKQVKDLLKNFKF